MFAQIDTKGATHILIHVPHEGAEKSLPALAGMLEKNAVFVRSGYNENEIITPTMGIVLGDTANINLLRNEELVIKVEASGPILDDTFVLATPQVFTSNAKAMAAKDSEIQKLRNELQFTKDSLSREQQKTEELERRLTAISTADAADVAD